MWWIYSILILILTSSAQESAPGKNYIFVSESKIFI